MAKQSPFEFMDSLANNTAKTLTGQYPPSQNGLTTRQKQVPPNRDAVSTRKAMRFLVPEQPIVELYINPQSIQYQHKKSTSTTRVKGGYVLQYWGEELPSISINGTTGTSGIEGINVLMDVYRNEQLMFDPYALFLQSQKEKEDQKGFTDLVFGDEGIVSTIGDVFNQLNNSQNTNVTSSRNKPTLASLAFTVEMYWMGEVYRGFFEGFNFKESVDRLGLFDYDFSFKVTQKRGFRTNFMPWHHHPSYGQSNWSQGGPPLSYGNLINPNISGRPITGTNQQVLNSISSNEEIDPFEV